MFKEVATTFIFTASLLTHQAAHASVQPTCSVVGDSIAHGTATFLPQCQEETKVGINTKDALNRFTTLPKASTTIISLGINDSGTFLPTRHNLEQMRSRVPSGKVIWILPSYPDKKAIVVAVAHENNDQTLDVDRLISSDHIHPTWLGYQTIARELALNN